MLGMAGGALLAAHALQRLGQQPPQAAAPPLLLAGGACGKGWAGGRGVRPVIRSASTDPEWLDALTHSLTADAATAALGQQEAVVRGGRQQHQRRQQQLLPHGRVVYACGLVWSEKAEGTSDR